MLLTLCSLLLGLFILVPKTVIAYERGTFNLESPTNLEKGQGEIKIRHRFYGEVSEEPFDTFFGMDLGANVGISLRYTVWSGLGLNISRVWNRKEGTFGASYAYSVPGTPLRSQIHAQVFSYEEFDFEKNAEERQNGIFSLLSLQSKPAFNRVTPAVNVGYDSDNQEFGAGLGLSIVVFEYLGLIQRINAIGEYFPTRSESENERSFAFGLRIETYGHHFDLILHNNSENGVRRLMSGAITDGGLRFGFNIKRLIGT
jgi:hypothetical protein